MGRFVKGDVVVLPFPFSDLSAGKRRPALVIAPLQTHQDVILCMITSQTRDGDAIPLLASDFREGSLPRDSFIRPNRLFTADGGIILRVAGKITQEKMNAVVEKLIEIISNGENTSVG